MTYELKIEQKPTYLHAVVTGTNSKENVLGYTDEIDRECTAQGTFRVLIEERLEGPRLGTMDVFEVVLRRVQRARRFKAIAYVDTNAVGDSMRFAENLAVNRFVPVAVFRTLADAERWIIRQGEKEGAAS
jgi:hypothetical protein